MPFGLVKHCTQEKKGVISDLVGQAVCGCACVPAYRSECMCFVCAMCDVCVKCNVFSVDVHMHVCRAKCVHVSASTGVCVSLMYLVVQQSWLFPSDPENKEYCPCQLHQVCRPLLG